jgi:hypothetical protein
VPGRRWKGSFAHVNVEGGDPDGALSDEELTALAMAADPDAPLPDDAVPIGIHLARFGASLPFWYMPPAVSRGGRRWKTPFVIAAVSAFLLIDAAGLCNTYGILSLA